MDGSRSRGLSWRCMGHDARSTPPAVVVLTLGCKLNQADSGVIARRLAGEGVRVVDRPERGADAFVINTCSVTHVADRKARRLVRLARRLSPGAQVVLTGCYAESMSLETAAAMGADAVVRNDGKGAIPERLLGRLRERGDPSAGCAAVVRFPLRTRAFVKVQEGCDEMCAFCIVPYTRGRERSVPVERIVEEVRAREAEGVREAVLTGTQLGNYGRGLGWSEAGPRRLIETLLERTSLPRIRLSSLQAQDISLELLRLWEDRRLCPHFHLPLQSGSDAVLKAMRRRYTADEYRRAAEMVLERVPDAAVTTDVIAGFPGETHADFEATYALCRETGFADIHAFPYSRRPNTGAALMPGHLPPEVRRGRLERLLALARESAEGFRSRFLGRTMDVLWERESGGRWQGLTGNYIRVYTFANTDLCNRIVPARLASAGAGGVQGETEEGAVLGL